MLDEDALVSPTGLIRCLRMLAEEASELRLSRTFAALLDLVEVAEAEACLAVGETEFGTSSRAIH